MIALSGRVRGCSTFGSGIGAASSGFRAGGAHVTPTGSVSPQELCVMMLCAGACVNLNLPSSQIISHQYLIYLVPSFMCL